jgi:hypothetical protein
MSAHNSRRTDLAQKGAAKWSEKRGSATTMSFDADVFDVDRSRDERFYGAFVRSKEHVPVE